MLATAIIAGGLTFATTSQAQQEPGKGKSGQGKARPGQGKARPGQGKARPGQGKTRPGQGETRPGQGQRPQRGGGFSRSNPYSQLDLTEAQQKKMAALQQEQSAATRKMFEELRGGGGDREAMRAKFTEMREKFQKQTEAILTDAQKKKLAEMRANGPQRPEGGGQRPGGGAGRRDPYAALNLTDDQKKKVTAIQDAQRTEMRKLFSGGNREGMREKMTAMREKTNKQIEAILTDEQKKKFKEMQSQRPTRPQGRPGGEGKGKQRPGRSDA